MTPFKAMFGVHASELDNEIGVQTTIAEDQVLEKIWQKH